jgi:hypothetical protein
MSAAALNERVNLHECARGSFAPATRRKIAIARPRARPARTSRHPAGTAIDLRLRARAAIPARSTSPERTCLRIRTRSVRARPRVADRPEVRKVGAAAARALAVGLIDVAAWPLTHGIRTANVAASSDAVRRLDAEDPPVGQESKAHAAKQMRATDASRRPVGSYLVRVQVRDAGVGSVLPRASRARTSNVCVPLPTPL